MHLIPFKGRNSSTHYNLNLLFQNGKTYIMDNHLAASWCWLQKIDLEKQYNLLHIDRHYDLLQSQIDWWIEALQEQNIDLKTISISNLIAIQYRHKEMPTADSFPLFRWDNYLTILHRLYPNLIASATFATHKDGDIIEELEFSEPDIYELQENLSYWINSNNKNKWIVNLDIDYFFTDYNEVHFQFLTDEYVLKIAEEIKESWRNIEVLTIALSPELCGGWDSAVRVARLITEYLETPWTE
jgi:hypothetical protein